MAIRDYHDKDTASFVRGERVRRFEQCRPGAVKAIAKLQAATRLMDLRNPPSNRFEALAGEPGRYSIRIDNKWRVCFRWAPSEPPSEGTDPLMVPASPATLRSPTTMIEERATMSYTATDKLPPVHPGEILRDELEALDLSARKFAEAIGVPPNAVTQILRGERGISAEMALRLGIAFGTDERYWMNLQNSYDAKVARAKMADKLPTIRRLVAT